MLASVVFSPASQTLGVGLIHLHGPERITPPIQVFGRFLKSNFYLEYNNTLYFLFAVFQQEVLKIVRYFSSSPNKDSSVC